MYYSLFSNPGFQRRKVDAYLQASSVTNLRKFFDRCEILRGQVDFKSLEVLLHVSGIRSPGQGQHPNFSGEGKDRLSRRTTYPLDNLVKLWVMKDLLVRRERENPWYVIPLAAQ